MKKLGGTGRAWLKGFHILFTAAWVGAALCMMLAHLSYHPETGAEMHGVLATLKLIDDWVIIPSAIGSLLTGLLISWLTPWGFFKWRWVTVKWVLTIAIMLAGTFVLGPWLNAMEAMAALDPQRVLHDSVFLSNRQSTQLAVVPQVLFLFFMVFISVLKPWKRSTHVGK
jgi:hypothetical protein